MNRNDWTIRKLIGWTSDYFKRNSIQNPRLDAEVLLAHALNTDRVSLYMQADKPLTKEELSIYRGYIQRRTGRVPVAYITGNKEFYSRNFAVDNNVLIPRPETEILVDAAIDYIKRKPYSSSKINILDIGTGSGNIAVTLACEAPGTNIFAADLSFASLMVARKNALIHKVTGSIYFFCGDLTCPVLNRKNFHIIISNPPYIPRGDIEGLEPELLKEPRVALDGNKDGLYFITKIMTASPKMLTDGGMLFLEIGYDQADKVSALAGKIFGDSVDIRLIKDYSGVSRVAAIRINPHGGISPPRYVENRAFNRETKVYVNPMFSW